MLKEKSIIFVFNLHMLFSKTILGIDVIMMEDSSSQQESRLGF